MSADGQRTKWWRKSSESFNRLSRAHERYRQTTDDRQTDRRRHIANMNLSSRSLKTVCANITTSQGYRLPWTNEIRYLGTYIVKSRQCVPQVTQKSLFFFLPMQYLLKSTDRTASEEVILELLRSKFIPVLIYGLEYFSLPKMTRNRWILLSLDF